MLAGFNLTFPREGLSSLMCFTVLLWTGNYHLKQKRCLMKLHRFYLQGARGHKLVLVLRTLQRMCYTWKLGVHGGRYWSFIFNCDETHTQWLTVLLALSALGLKKQLSRWPRLLLSAMEKEEDQGKRTQAVLQGNVLTDPWTHSATNCKEVENELWLLPSVLRVRPTSN